MGHRFVPTPVTTGLYKANDGTPVHIHGYIISETVGSTNLTVTLYTSPTGGNAAVNPTGTTGDFAFAVIEVPKGTGPASLIDHEGFQVTGGLYIKTSGGTAAGSILVR